MIQEIIQAENRIRKAISKIGKFYSAWPKEEETNCHNQKWKLAHHHASRKAKWIIRKYDAHIYTSTLCKLGEMDKFSRTHFDDRPKCKRRNEIFQETGEYPCAAKLGDDWLEGDMKSAPSTSNNNATMGKLDFIKSALQRSC